jgi:hypothetical protein
MWASWPFGWKEWLVSILRDPTEIASHLRRQVGNVGVVRYPTVLPGVLATIKGRLLWSDTTGLFHVFSSDNDSEARSGLGFPVSAIDFVDTSIRAPQPSIILKGATYPETAHTTPPPQPEGFV